MSQRDEDDILLREKWVRIMGDYGAEGVWDKDGVSRYPESLPISRGLMDRIYAWQEWYTRLEDRYYEEDLSWADEAYRQDVADMSAAGLVVAQAVKAELPDWTVIYVDELKMRDVVNKRVKAGRGYYEWEIASGFP